MYIFLFGKMPLPVTPSKIEMQTGSNNKIYNVISEGEINILKSPTLREISFEFELPTTKRAYALYDGSFIPAQVYLEYIKLLKEDKEPFQLIITRMTGTTVNGFDNIKVSLEDYTVTEDRENGLDFVVSVKLKEYGKSNSLLNVVTAVAGGVASAVANTFTQKKSSRDTKTSPKPKKSVKKYKVKKGDTLWAIAKKYYNDGSKYTLIQKENKIENPNKIQVGQELTIPKEK